MSCDVREQAEKEKRKHEESRKAEEKRNEAARRAEEKRNEAARRADDKRKAEEARKAEQDRKVEVTPTAEEGEEACHLTLIGVCSFVIVGVHPTRRDSPIIEPTQSKNDKTC